MQVEALVALDLQQVEFALRRGLAAADCQPRRHLRGQRLETLAQHDVHDSLIGA